MELPDFLLHITGDQPLSLVLTGIEQEALRRGLLGQGENRLREWLAHFPWCGPLHTWLDDDTVKGIEVGAGGSLIVDYADGRVQAAGQYLSTEWVHFLVSLWRLNRGAAMVRSPLTATTTALFSFTFVDESFSPLGPTLAVRKGSSKWTLERLVQEGMFDSPIADFLRKLVQGRVNLLLAGGRGSGRTALLEALLCECASLEQIIVVAEQNEFTLPDHPRSVIWECNPDRPEIEVTHLLQEAARRRPDRVAVGELRGREAAEWITALNAGAAGIASIHAATPHAALERLLALGRLDPLRAVPAEWIITAHLVVIQLGSTRRVTEITECTGTMGVGAKLRFTTAELFPGRGSEPIYVLCSDALLEKMGGD